MGYIYKIINTVNNKIYIGKTEETIERRLYEHKLCVKTGSKQSRLYSAMKHYGVDKFIVEELDHSDSSEELCEKEKYWIKKLNSQDPKVGYNIAPGGEGGFTWSAKGYVTMNKDNKNTFVKPENVNDYLENGWNLGGKKLKLDSKKVRPSSVEQSADDSRRRGLWINNGEKQIRVLPDELQIYLNNGWVRGYCEEVKDKLSSSHKGKVPWNKGISSSAETRNKISKTISGSKWMNNGITSLQVKEKDIQLYIDKGYKFGRIIKKKEGNARE